MDLLTFTDVGGEIFIYISYIYHLNKFKKRNFKLHLKLNIFHFLDDVTLIRPGITHKYTGT